MAQEPDYTAHQFNLFPFAPPRVKRKITTARIREAMIELGKGRAGNNLTIIQGLRDLNDSLEILERRIK